MSLLLLSDDSVGHVASVMKDGYLRFSPHLELTSCPVGWAVPLLLGGIEGRE